MSAADKTKLDGMNTTIDKAIANHTATDAEVPRCWQRFTASKPLRSHE